MEFAFRCVGEPPIAGEPLDAARQVLVKAIEEIRTQQVESGAKDRLPSS